MTIGQPKVMDAIPEDKPKIKGRTGLVTACSVPGVVGTRVCRRVRVVRLTVISVESVAPLVGVFSNFCEGSSSDLHIIALVEHHSGVSG